MTQSEDTEITLGTGKLLVLFFGLVAVCALFFGLGYSLGRRSDVTPLASSPSLQAASGLRSAAVKSAQGTPSQPPMTFYKSVEQKDVRSQLAPASEDVNSAGGGSSGGTSNPADTSAAKDQTAATSSAPDPMAMPATNGYYVQVAAVSKDEDAQSLVDALKKKQYPAFVASNSTDKLFRVQVGPFADIKDAESMRARLINDGYNPILKK